MANRKEKNLVDPEKSKEILDVLRKIIEIKNLATKITKEDAVHAMQTVLYIFKQENYILDGQRVIQNLIEPTTFKEDFDNIEELIERLCQKRITQSVFEKINQK